MHRTSSTHHHYESPEYTSTAYNHLTNKTMPYKSVFKSAKAKYNPDPSKEIAAPTPEWQKYKGTSKPVLFWKPIGAFAYLCQWYIAPMRDDDGQEFTCCEQYMMYHKAATFNDVDTMALILSEPHPKNQKDLGRGVMNFDPAIWDEVKYEIVLKGNYLKFTQCHALPDDAWVYGEGGRKEEDDNVSLQQLLLATGDRELAEASKFDRIWGIGFGAADAEAHRMQWGENLLGKVLMETRARLRG